MTRSENETKLDQVQARFPSDALYLSETVAAMEVTVHVLAEVGVHLLSTLRWICSQPAELPW